MGLPKLFHLLNFFVRPTVKEIAVLALAAGSQKKFWDPKILIPPSRAKKAIYLTVGLTKKFRQAGAELCQAQQSFSWGYLLSQLWLELKVMNKS